MIPPTRPFASPNESELVRFADYVLRAQRGDLTAAAGGNQPDKREAKQ